MRGIIITFLANAAALYAVTSGLLPGVRIEGEERTLTIAAFAIILGLVNALVKPVLKLLTCPLIVFTLGLFLLVINAAMFALAVLLGNQLAPLIGGRLVIDDVGQGLLAVLVVSVVGTVAAALLDLIFPGERERVKVVRETRVVIERHRVESDAEFEARLRAQGYMPPPGQYPPGQYPPGQYPPQGGVPPSAYPPNPYPPSSGPPPPANPSDRFPPPDRR
jgi:putative membrane protein